MKTKKTLFFLFSLTLISTGVFTVTLFNVNPWEADIITRGAFFASIFFVIVGILTFLGYYIRLVRSNHLATSSTLSASIRQASLFALIIIGFLLLNTLRVFNWWDAILLAISIGMLELFFQTRSADVLSFVAEEKENG